MSSVQDPISDYLTRIRNASRAGKEYVDIPSSGIKENITRILKQEGYVKHYKVISDNKQGVLRVYLKYASSDRKVLNQLKRVSKPNKRVYVQYKNVQKVRGGMGISIISTSLGLLTAREARKKQVGGELLLKVW